MSRFSDAQGITGADQMEERLKRVEEQQAAWGQRFFSTFVIGRLRTDRTTPPATSADVNDSDQIYDVIRIYPYEYILINNDGAYNWVRLTMSTF